MPTYQYACTECGHAFDQFQSFSDDALTECPECSGRLRKLFNAVGVVFKGSGFYRNDSRSTAKSSGDPGDRGGRREDVRTPTSSEKKSDVQRRSRAPPPPPPDRPLWRTGPLPGDLSYRRGMPAPHTRLDRVHRIRRAVRRRVLARRRPLAALCAGDRGRRGRPQRHRSAAADGGGRRPRPETCPPGSVLDESDLEQRAPGARRGA